MKMTEKEKFDICYNHKKIDGFYSMLSAYTFPKLDFDFPDMECDQCEIIGGCLTLFNGFKWNGATCCPDWKNIMRASAGHDGIFALLKKYKLKKLVPLANKQLYKWCRQDGMNWFTAKIIVHFGTNLGSRFFI